jgi:hypothetical protein
MQIDTDRDERSIEICKRSTEINEPCYKYTIKHVQRPKTRARWQLLSAIGETSWHDATDTDAVITNILHHRISQAIHAEFRSTEGGASGDTMDGEQAWDVEDVASTLLPHNRNGLVPTIENTGKVCLNAGIPFLSRKMVNRLENANACVIHQDIDPTELCRCLLNHLAAISAAANVRDGSSRAGFGPEGGRWPSAVFSVAGLRPQINTLAPSRTKASAMFNLMPRAPPVTSATLPSNFTDTTSPFENPALSTAFSSRQDFPAHFVKTPQYLLTHSVLKSSSRTLSVAIRARE